MTRALILITFIPSSFVKATTIREEKEKKNWKRSKTHYLWMTQYYKQEILTMLLENQQSSSMKFQDTKLIHRNALHFYTHPLLLPPSIFPSIRVFSNESVPHIRWPKDWRFSFQHQSFQWIFRIDFFQDGLVGSPCRSRDTQESSPIPQFKSIISLTFSFLYSSTLTFIHDYWKNHSHDQMDFCWQSNVSAF